MPVALQRHKSNLPSHARPRSVGGSLIIVIFLLSLLLLSLLSLLRLGLFLAVLALLNCVIASATLGALLGPRLRLGLALGFGSGLWLLIRLGNLHLRDVVGGPIPLLLFVDELRQHDLKLLAMAVRSADCQAGKARRHCSFQQLSCRVLKLYQRTNFKNGISWDFQSLRRRHIDNANGAQGMYHFHVEFSRQHGATEHALQLPGFRRVVARLVVSLLAVIGRFGQEHMPAAQDVELLLPDSDAL